MCVLSPNFCLVMIWIEVTSKFGRGAGGRNLLLLSNIAGASSQSVSDPRQNLSVTYFR